MSNSNRTETLVLIEVAGNTFGLRSESVRSVEMAGPTTPVPNTLPFVEGITLTRGQFIPTVNLRTRLGFSSIPVDSRARVVVVHSRARTVGMLVDSSREFLFIPADAIRPPGDSVGSLSARYVEGITSLGNRSVLVLNLDEVIQGV